MPNPSIPKTQSVYMPITVYGPGGPNATPPDVDLTTPITNANLTVSGTDVAAQVVSTDPQPIRRLRVDATGPNIGANRANIAVTVNGKTANQLIDVIAAPDRRAVVLGTPTAAFDTPAPSDPVQFP